MNKGITILLMAVILGAMGLVLFSHVTAEKNDVAARKGDVGVAGGPAGAGMSLTDLIRIDPPMSSLNPPDAPAPDGAPRTVRVIAGVSPGRDEARVREDDARADARTQGMPQAQQAPAGESPAGRTGDPPGLTPWETPPASSPTARTNDLPPAYAAPLRPTPPPAAQQVPASDSASAKAPNTRPASVAPSSPATNGPEEQRPSPAEPAPRSVVAPEAPSGATSGNTPKGTRPPQTGPSRSGQTPDTSFKNTHTLKNVSLTFADDAMRLRIEADGAFPCKTFTLSGPDRLVIDLPGAWKGMKAPTVPGNRIIGKARAGLQSAGARLVLDLNSPLKNHKVERRGNVVEILVQ
jgi:hypothetical protein